MKHRLVDCALCALVALAFVVPVTVFGALPSATAAQKEWTLLMYWDADNSLEFCTEFAMQTWEEALTSNSEVSIVALVDILSAEGIWIYDIQDGERNLVTTWEEKNTSDPAVLKEFVQYGMDNFPAEKTMLVVQDHGYGWRGICQDETNGDVLMPIDGLAASLREVKAENGDKGVDLLAFDACNMGTIEVAYELRGAASYMVASQTMVPFDGLPYEMFITDLMEDPSIGPAALAENIVYEYVEYYSSKRGYHHIMKYSQDFATIAAIDLSKMDDVGTTFGAMTSALEPLVEDHLMEIEKARGYSLVGAWANMAGYEWMPDAYTFVDGLRAIPDHPELIAAIDAFEDAFNTAVFAHANSKKYHDTVHGLNIWFPPSMSQYNSQGWIWARQFVYHESDLDLVSESMWYECLLAYYGADW
ncbi:MAG TPA: clostripain-related cysteine peptidase [Thermoplasmata archaeon]